MIMDIVWLKSDDAFGKNIMCFLTDEYQIQHHICSLQRHMEIFPTGKSELTYSQLVITSLNMHIKARYEQGFGLTPHHFLFIVLL